ncbi:MAG: HlyD family efflux transporter periplasmic adaptor subunit [Sedimentisphaerales bacterium]|nr:HlyD family efflux transporter periplasmic adaptor subunit [Sedimentisphaerales bacterium]
MERLSFTIARLRPHILPVLVWLVAVAVVGLLFHHRSQRFEILGMAQGQVLQVAATCTGRLKSVPVKLFDEVRRGDVVAVLDAVLDNEHLEAELATANAEVQRLMAALAHTQQTLLAEAANLETDRIAAQRRFFVDVENARLRVLELKTQVETQKAALKDLERNTENYLVQNLSDQNDAAYFELKKMKGQQDVLAKEIEENQRLLEEAEGHLKQAEQRRDEFAQLQPQYPPLDSALEVIRREVKVQEKKIDELLARREPVVLKSPIDGIVVQLHGRARDVAAWRPGEFVVRRQDEVVLAGDSILSIAESKPREIIAYANRHQLGRLKEGMAVRLVKNTEPQQIADSQVAYLGPTLERMPECLWLVPNTPQWGHPVLIPIPPGLKLVPGEMVGIRGL